MIDVAVRFPKSNDYFGATQTGDGDEIEILTSGADGFEMEIDIRTEEGDQPIPAAQEPWSHFMPTLVLTEEQAAGLEIVESDGRDDTMTGPKAYLPIRITVKS